MLPGSVSITAVGGVGALLHIIKSEFSVTVTEPLVMIDSLGGQAAVPSE